MNGWKDIFGQVLGQVSEHLPVEDPDTHQAIRLHAKTQQHLHGTWGYAQRTRQPCQQRVRDPRGQVLRCVEAMAGPCVACRAPVCLHHSAAVFDTGDLICFACIGHAQRTVQQQGPAATDPRDARDSRRDAGEDDDKLRRKHMKRLKLTGEPSEDEIRAAWKREAAKTHPDRMPADKKQKAQEKFVLLGEAKDWLLAHAKKKAA